MPPIGRRVALPLPFGATDRAARALVIDRPAPPGLLDSQGGPAAQCGSPPTAQGRP
ncbi:hypothetical protein [Belnapia moabensis]|uniref:hypothetical protein n=1 Tax=Belnapia moabensis TaxID=365533 RepID=UPI0012EE61A6|nr:hypothetical protein [Belnapia moabensis]